MSGLLTRTTAAFSELIARCDGPEGVRADGSNIDTRAAHAALEEAEAVLAASAARKANIADEESAPDHP